MDIHPSTASNLVKQLVQRDLVTLAPHPEDRRAWQILLAPGGAALLARWPGPFVGVLPAALSGLDDATLARLEADLGTVIERLGADASAGSTPLSDM
jgi:DNA-binding MarR family transcriptional regulator